MYFEAQTPSGSVGGAHLRATFDRSDGGAYAIADCLSTAVEVGDVIVPTAPSTGLAVLAGTNVAMRVVVSPVNAASLFETDWEVARRKSDFSYWDCELENHIGVASTLPQLAIREFATSLLGSSAFAKASPLPSQHGFSALPAEKPKCNAFVAHCAVHPNTSDHGHVGIVDYDGWEVGAGEKMVHRRFGPPMDGTTYFSTKENEP